MNQRGLSSWSLAVPSTVLLIILLAALVGCGGIEISWKDRSKVHDQTGEGCVTIPEFPVGKCGVVAISAVVTDTGAEIVFKFAPVKPRPEGCCEAYGWIQHVDRAGAWTFDNGAAGQAGAVKYGYPSDPTLNPQPIAAANPWYGGSGSVTDAMDTVPDDWDEQPRPQSTIKDSPGCNEGHGFITQLVCVETGDIVFEYRWRLQPRNGDCEFHGAEGNNITFDLGE